MTTNDPLWEARNSAKPRAQLLKTLKNHFPTTPPGRALDLGCSTGRDTLELLKRGWSVDAIDIDEDALETLSERAQAYPNLSMQLTEFENLDLPEDTYDLINARYSVPFCHPKKFQYLWKQVTSALKPGGYLTCDFFGDRDSWRNHPLHRDSITFLTLEGTKNLLSTLYIESIEEDEYDAPTLHGPNKHWHIISCVARRPQ